jgi:hypothetical protein
MPSPTGQGLSPELPEQLGGLVLPGRKAMDDGSHRPLALGSRL